MGEPRPTDAYVQRDPVGSYRRRLNCESLDGRRVFIHLTGVDSAFISGQRRVRRFSKDSRTPAEFDLNDYCHAGRTRSGGSLSLVGRQLLEDQDMWRMSGIFRACIFIHRSGTTPDVAVRTGFGCGYGMHAADQTGAGCKNISLAN